MITIDKQISHRKLVVEEMLKKKNIEGILQKITTEGESKKIHQIDENHCIVVLKPTLYSYTFNRYGIVAGTDTWRYKLWELFSDVINNELISYLKQKPNLSLKINTLMRKLIVANTGKDWSETGLTAFHTLMTNNDKAFAVCNYIPMNEQTPLEVVWKDYFVGTMKHHLLFVDKYPTIDNETITIEGKLPNSIVRFDWRNPFEFEGNRYKDEAIPDDFAAFWINVNNAKLLAQLLSEIINEYLKMAGYHLVDICYFLTKSGDMVFSEITPDGMRIKKSEQSFDKDLWRIGKQSEELTLAWSQLYGDLKGLLTYE